MDRLARATDLRTLERRTHDVEPASVLEGLRGVTGIGRAGREGQMLRVQGRSIGGPRDRSWLVLCSVSAFFTTQGCSLDTRPTSSSGSATHDQDLTHMPSSGPDEPDASADGATERQTSVSDEDPEPVGKDGPDEPKESREPARTQDAALAQQPEMDAGTPDESNMSGADGGMDGSALDPGPDAAPHEDDAAIPRHLDGGNLQNPLDDGDDETLWNRLAELARLNPEVRQSEALLRVARAMSGGASPTNITSALEALDDIRCRQAQDACVAVCQWAWRNCGACQTEPECLDALNRNCFFGCNR